MGSIVGEPMKGVGVPTPGAIDRLGPVELPDPAPAAGQVAVRVVASAINPADLKVLRGELAGRTLHARTSPLVAGFDVSGIIEACGTGVSDVAAGDEVFGFLAYSWRNRQGAFAERIVVARGEVGRKPAAIGHDVAAAAATPGLTALQLLRDKGRLASGGRVLVIGAAGGVGSLAVGVAQQLGSTVTAVCSARAIEFVRGLGATEVIDRSQRDPRSAEGPFEIVLDAAAAYGFASLRHLLTPDGAYLTTLPSGAFIGGKLMSLVSRRRCHLIVVRSVAADLEQLAAWIAAGMKVPIDTRFPVRDLRQALDRLASGQVCGRVGVQVEGGF